MISDLAPTRTTATTITAVAEAAAATPAPDPARSGIAAAAEEIGTAETADEEAIPDRPATRQYGRVTNEVTGKRK